MVVAEKNVVYNDGAQADFIESAETFPAFMGGFRCMAPETLVSGVPIADRIASDEVRTLIGVSPATGSFLKGEADLYRVVTRSGREVVVTLGHRFLTPRGWGQLADLSVGDYVAADGSEHGLLDSQTGRDYQDCCSSDSHPDDGLSFLAAAGILDGLPLPHGQTVANGPSLLHGHPSTNGDPPLSLEHDCAVANPLPQTASEWTRGAHGIEARSFQVTTPLWCITYGTPRDQLQRALLRMAFALGLHEYQSRFSASKTPFLDLYPSPLLPPSVSQVPSKGEAPRQGQPSSSSYTYCSNHILASQTFWDEVVLVKFERTGEFYDLCVPGSHHYSGNGLWHHNSGKTAAGVFKCVKYTMEHPGSVGVWTEPVAAMFAEVLMPTLRKFFEEYEGQLWQEQGRGGPNHRIEFANDCLWMLKAAETPERLVGFECAWVLMDEAASTEHGSQEDAYLKLVGRLSQQGYPHWLGITSTPAGYNWIWREWLESPKPGHVLFRGSSLENPKLEDIYLEELARTYVPGTPLYRQYVLGEFVQMSGLVIPGFDVEKMTGLWPDELFTYKLAGVDFGSQSPTTIIETAMTPSRHIWVREWLYKRECADETFVKACGAAMDSGVTQFICDPSGKDRIEWMCRQGIPAVKAESNKIERRVKAWTSPIGEGRLTVDQDSGFLIRELLGLVWAERRGRDMETDRFSQNSPDHGFDGGAYSLMKLDRGYFDLEKISVRYAV